MRFIAFFALAILAPPVHSEEARVRVERLEGDIRLEEVRAYSTDGTHLTATQSHQDMTVTAVHTGGDFLVPSDADQLVSQIVTCEGAARVDALDITFTPQRIGFSYTCVGFAP